MSNSTSNVVEQNKQEEPPQNEGMEVDKVCMPFHKYSLFEL